MTQLSSESLCSEPRQLRVGWIRDQGGSHQFQLLHCSKGLSKTPQVFWGYGHWTR